MKLPHLRYLLLVLCSAACATATAAEPFPNRPVTLVVPFPTSGPSDMIARTMGAAMGRHLRQPVVIENVGGAGGTVGAAQVAQAAPDGYTVLLYHVGMATAPTQYPDLPFDPLRDFEPLGEVTEVPMTLVARRDFPVASAHNLGAYLRAHRGQVRLAHAGLGSASQLCGLLLMSALGETIPTIAYKGTGPAMNELLAGKVDLMCDQTTSTTAPIRAGKITALGLTTQRRIASLPEIPTLQEAGLTDFQVVIWHGMYVPRGTPPAIVNRLVEALHAALLDSGVKARFNDLGTDSVPLDKATPQHLRRHLGEELVRWGAAIKRLGHSD